MLNDAHCHFFSQRFFETLALQKGLEGLSAEQAASTLTTQLEWETPGLPATLADRWIAELDRHEVGRAALIASVPRDEESVAIAVSRHPTRFVGYFMIDPTAEDAADRVAATMARPGMRCACLFPAMHRYSLTDERVLRIVEAIAAQPGTALFVHCGMLSVGVRKKLGLPNRFEMRFGNPLDLQLLASTQTRLPIIIPHFGAGLLREALMVADACTNIYLDTSSSNGWLKYHPGLTLPQVFRQALAVVGPDRLLFGTDSSFFPRGWQRPIYDQQQAAVDSVCAERGAVDRIFGGNFDRLFPRSA
jgi:predicted TIM-barrel fold metal-dependent hydrolase